MGGAKQSKQESKTVIIPKPKVERTLLATSIVFCLVGDSAVGKSSFIQRVSENTFSDAYIMNNSEDGLTKHFYDNIKLEHTANLVFRDTGGQERFRNIRPYHYRGAHVILIFFDIHNKESFDNANRWYIESERYGSENHPIRVLVGTKSDIPLEGKSNANLCEELKKEILELSVSPHTLHKNITARIVLQKFTTLFCAKLKFQTKFRFVFPEELLTQIFEYYSQVVIIDNIRISELKTKKERLLLSYRSTSEVSDDEAREFAFDRDFNYMKISSRNNEGIEELLEYCVENAISQIEMDEEY
jgi:small GTP-binding protein